MRKIAYLFVLTFLFASCEKDSDNLTVLLNQSGTLSIKVVDNSQSGFKGSKVSIYSSIPDGERIYNDSTDINGICDIGKVLQGQYEYYVSAVKDNITYSCSEYFQVIAGDDKTIETNPFLNVGDARVKIVNINSEPIAEINVALIPHPNYSNVDYYLSDLIDEAYAIGKTDSEGWVEFQDLPAGSRYGGEYSVVVYYNSENFDYPTGNNYVYITRDSNSNFTLRFDI